ncbi:RNA-binding S4 domain-containing protein [Mariluticola halotolerans]|uniref:RNA-binding S4 domain-containing protein n=1 Tax=Mariluticola halotolerans TaxID=2909283 RepID=UPI0026E1CACE|nr:RNA-binding S4 domain-containing protein [Mariluticola halotolerans]UJQ93824.1 RNA-binding S4 domain-containing protein [Mariluticola halotolerans]
MNEPARQRLDKWLWFARILKSRTLAQKLITSGAVRIDGNRVTGADYRVVPGMVLTMTVHEQLRILKIVDTGERRGPASEAAELYEDLTPALPPREKKGRPSKPGVREPGAGRPTKRERRLTDRFTGKGNSRTGA